LIGKMSLHETGHGETRHEARGHSGVFE
jgi:hypothetical protein